MHHWVAKLVMQQKENDLLHYSICMYHVFVYIQHHSQKKICLQCYSDTLECIVVVRNLMRYHSSYVEKCLFRQSLSEATCRPIASKLEFTEE